jgi:hypothetical protein
LHFTITFGYSRRLWVQATPGSKAGNTPPYCMKRPFQATPSLLIRGGVTVGNIVKSYGQLFGPAVVRAYELESKIAIYPRIVVGEEVFEELENNRGLWMHDKRDEKQAVRNLLRTGDDGELYVDYLRVIRDELDDPVTEYDEFLNRHQSLITECLQRYSGNDNVRAKYTWMDRYHQLTLRDLKTTLRR